MTNSYKPRPYMEYGWREVVKALDPVTWTWTERVWDHHHAYETTPRKGHQSHVRDKDGLRRHRPGRMKGRMGKINRLLECGYDA